MKKTLTGTIAGLVVLGGIVIAGEPKGVPAKSAPAKCKTCEAHTKQIAQLQNELLQAKRRNAALVERINQLATRLAQGAKHSANATAALLQE